MEDETEEFECKICFDEKDPAQKFEHDRCTFSWCKNCQDRNKKYSNLCPQCREPIPGVEAPNETPEPILEVDTSTEIFVYALILDIAHLRQCTSPRCAFIMHNRMITLVNYYTLCIRILNIELTEDQRAIINESKEVLLTLMLHA